MTANSLFATAMQAKFRALILKKSVEIGKSIELTSSIELPLKNNEAKKQNNAQGENELNERQRRMREGLKSKFMKLVEEKKK